MTVHDRYKAEGLCYVCGKQPPTLRKDGKRATMCESCLERFKGYYRTHDFMRKTDDDEQIQKCLTCDLPVEYCIGRDCVIQRWKWSEGKKP